MSEQDKIQAINELLVIWKSGELSSYDFAVSIEKLLEKSL